MALSVDYANKYNQFPPVYMLTLLQIASNEVHYSALEIINEAQQLAQRNVLRGESTFFHSIGSELAVSPLKAIDDYINKIRNMVENVKMVYLERDEELLFERKLQGIYEVIKRSIFDEKNIIEKW